MWKDVDGVVVLQLVILFRDRHEIYSFVVLIDTVVYVLCIVHTNKA